MLHNTDRRQLNAGMSDAVAMYSGQVMHRRLFPVSYRFIYRIMNLLIDVDQLDEAHRNSFLFSVNRFNLLAFYSRDHLPADKAQLSLREWAETILLQHDVQTPPHRILLLAFPRVLGWVFNPMSVWYCMDRDDKPLAVICEVNNTFREKHYYLLHGENKPMHWPVNQHHAKHFHVSPFTGMDADYEFRIGKPSDIATVSIREYQHGELMLVAAIKGRLIAFNTLNLVMQTLRVPLQTVKVLVAIHWHALWIWLSGSPFYTKPPAPKNEVS